MRSGERTAAISDTARGALPSRPVRSWAILALLLAACSEPAPARDAGAPIDASARDAGVDAPIGADADVDAGAVDAGALDAGAVDAGTVDAGAVDAGAVDGGALDAGPPDARVDAGGVPVYDVRVLADGACSDLSFDPPSIRVPSGSRFTVRWINATGCTDIDIDKDGTVPIVIGLEPGASYHDTVREWCGIFTGTFFFRAYYSATFPYYLDVDCSG